MLGMYRDCMGYDESNSTVSMPPITYNQGFSSNMHDVLCFTDFFPSIIHFRNTLLGDYSHKEKRSDFLFRILYPIRGNLQTLELNGWNKLSSISFLVPMSNTLTTLRLYDCPDVKNGVEHIMKLKNLQFLDISQTTPTNGIFAKPASTLYRLVSSLPKLKKLDIANTNLCLPFNEEDERVEER